MVSQARCPEVTKTALMFLLVQNCPTHQGLTQRMTTNVRAANVRAKCFRGLRTHTSGAFSFAEDPLRMFAPFGANGHSIGCRSEFGGFTESSQSRPHRGNIFGNCCESGLFLDSDLCNPARFSPRFLSMLTRRPIFTFFVRKKLLKI